MYPHGPTPSGCNAQRSGSYHPCFLGPFRMESLDIMYTVTTSETQINKQSFPPKDRMLLLIGVIHIFILFIDSLRMVSCFIVLSGCYSFPGVHSTSTQLRGGSGRQADVSFLSFPRSKTIHTSAKAFFQFSMKFENIYDGFLGLHGFVERT